MSITVHKEPKTKSVTVTITENLTFDSYKEFSESYKSLASEKFAQYIIDLRQIEYLDSSALGMLLRFKETVAAADQAIVLRVSKGAVADILKVSQFDRLFKLQIA